MRFRTESPVGLLQGLCAASAAALVLSFFVPAPAHGQGLLTRHVREEVSSGQAAYLGRLPSTLSLRLNIALPLRNEAGLDELLQQGRPIGTRLFVEQLLGKLGIVNGGDQIAMTLKSDATLLEHPRQPQPAVEADAQGEREPGLHADVTQAEALVQKVVIEVVAAYALLTRREQALIVAAQAISQSGLLTGEQGNASAGAAVLARQFEGESVLIDGRTVEMHRGNVLALGLFLALATQRGREFFAIVGEILTLNAVLEQEAIDAGGVIEQA